MWHNTYMPSQSIIFIMLDGVGLAPAIETNPLISASTPALQGLLHGPLTIERVQERQDLLLKPIDATLGVAGLPQSGTGHVALLAGVNASALIGHHQPHSPPIALHGLLAEQSIFHKVQALGARVAFANAFGPGYWQALTSRRMRRSASVIAAEGAGLQLRDLDGYIAGRALSWDITGEALRARENSDLPLRTPHEAGAVLAALAHEYELVFFECFLPDLAGHGRMQLSDEAAITRIDGLLGGLLSTKRPQDTLVISSDHGNIEDRTTPVHTRNPVPLLVVGPGAADFTRVEDIAGVTEAIITLIAAHQTLAPTEQP